MDKKMLDKNDRDAMLGWLEKLKASDKIIIVEGIKDVNALVRLGIPRDRIRRLNKAAFAVAEELAKEHKEAIILTDLDKEGKKLYASLKTNLTRNGVKVDSFFREFLFRNSDLSHIEGIDTYFRNLAAERP
ncbi:MAG: toprim domain-containing protein [Nanoarchaeota archaeon]|nr:toprim domain-containing protein [Nanoarchaeota archaeon]